MKAEALDLMGLSEEYMAKITFEEFKNGLTAINQIHVSRKIDACDWAYDGVCYFHNRTYWGRVNASNRLANLTPAIVFNGIFNDTKDSFWAGFFTDEKLAETKAEQYGAVVEKDFYCDDDHPSWFLIFENFDKCAKFIYDEFFQK